MGKRKIERLMLKLTKQSMLNNIPKILGREPDLKTEIAKRKEAKCHKIH